MNKKLFTLILLFPMAAFSSYQVGSGINSATGGRKVPSLNFGAGSDSFMMLFSTTGVATAAYYQSTYTLGAYVSRKAGDIASRPVITGFGAAALYSERGFQDTGTELEKKNDYVIGPAFYSQWNFYGPFYVSVEGLYGIIGPSGRWYDLVSLNARDHVNFIVGVTF